MDLYETEHDKEILQILKKAERFKKLGPDVIRMIYEYTLDENRIMVWVVVITDDVRKVNASIRHIMAYTGLFKVHVSYCLSDELERQFLEAIKSRHVRVKKTQSEYYLEHLDKLSKEYDDTYVVHIARRVYDEPRDFSLIKSSQIDGFHDNLNRITGLNRPPYYKFNYILASTAVRFSIVFQTLKLLREASATAGRNIDESDFYVEVVKSSTPYLFYGS